MEPLTSLKLIGELHLQSGDPIIDVGGGNSNLAIRLLESGYTNVSVLEISGICIGKMKDKFPQVADNINWLECDVSDFKPGQKYKLWHDRAVFHFFTTKGDKQKYKSSLLRSLDKDGYFILSTFSVEGPKRCSGLDISQYDLTALKSLFDDEFELMNAFLEDHITPAGKSQNFIFSVWKRTK